MNRIQKLYDAQHKETPPMLHYMNLRGLNLNGMDLSGFDLRYSDFTGARMAGTKLTGARLEGARLLNVQGLTQGQLKVALIDSQTILDDHSKTY